MIMAGATDEAIASVRPVLAALSRETICLGTTGAGATMKLAVNMLIHGLNQTLAESLTLAEAAGIPPADAYWAIEGSAAAAPMVEYRKPNYLNERTTTVSFALSLARKDVALAMELAAELGVCDARDTAESEPVGVGGGSGIRPARHGIDHQLLARYHMKKAALFVGGWEGHTPQAFCDWAVDLLEGDGFEVVSYETLAPLAEPAQLADVDLVVPIWSSARSSHRPEFGNMNKAEEDGLLQLIANGCGIAGWHGHMGDAFRDHPTYPLPDRWSVRRPPARMAGQPGSVR